MVNYSIMLELEKIGGFPKILNETPNMGACLIASPLCHPVLCVVMFGVVSLMHNLSLSLYSSWCSTSDAVLRPGPVVLLWEIFDSPFTLQWCMCILYPQKLRGGFVVFVVLMYLICSRIVVVL